MIVCGIATLNDVSFPSDVDEFTFPSTSFFPSLGDCLGPVVKLLCLMVC